MAAGTGNLPNQNMDFVPLATLPASDLDKLVENIESLADGSGIGDGAVTPAKWTNPYCFSAWDNTGSILTDGATSKINFNTEVYDYGSCYNATTSTFTAPFPCIMHFDANVTLGTIVSPVLMFVAIYKNGAEWKRGGIQPFVTGSGADVSCDVVLDINNTVTVFAYQDSAGNEDTSTAAGRTWFSGHLVTKLAV